MKRIDWLDRMKGILIILVVLGHAVGTASHYVSGSAAEGYKFAFKFIYFFHMPAFFFLAGLLFRDDVLLGEMMRKKARRLLVPYFVFGLASIVVFFAFRGMINHSGMSDKYYAQDFASISWWHMFGSLLYGASLPGTDGFRCNSVLWFLPCLFTCNCLMLGLAKIGKKALLIVTIVCCVPLFVFMNRHNCPSLPFGLSRLPFYFPFLTLGYLLRKRICFSSPVWLGLCAVYCVGCFFMEYAWWVRTSYLAWMAFMLMGALGAFACCVIAKLVRGEVLVRLGQASIGVMLIHKWLLLVLMKLGWQEAVSSTILCVGVSYGLTLLVRKYAPWALGEKK